MKRSILLTICLLLSGLALWGQNPVIAPTSLPNGIVGTGYSQTLTASSGYGVGTYGFAPYSGTLPYGIALSAGGVLSGTPTAVGTFTFTVQVTSEEVNSAFYVPPLTGTQSFTVVIYPALAITTAAASAGTVGVRYSQTYAASGGAGASTYSWSVVEGTTPLGLTLSAAGVLSGTPTSAGTFAFEVRVSSQIPALGAVTASQVFSVVIAPAALAITGSLGAGTVGVPYSATLGATGGYGAGSYTFSLASGSLPPGIQLSVAGTFSGTPTALGTSSFTVQVTSINANFAALTATQPFTLAIYPVLAFTPQSLNPGMVGASYSVGFEPVGGYGSGSYSYAVTTGTLPPGITLTNGILSGTPTAAGTFPFAVKVTNTPIASANGLPPLTATQSFTLVIYPALALSPQTLSPATVGTPYQIGFQPTGGYGEGTYSYSQTAGTLPPGITFVNGILSGTPTAPGTFTFTLQVANGPAASGTGLPTFTGTQSYTLVVNLPQAPPVTISGLPASPAPATQPVLGLTVGSPYPLAIQGTITLTFAPSNGADDPNVQFTTGGRTVTFQIPAGSTQAQFAGNAPGVQTGTVAGTITLTLDLTAAGTDITPTPAPTQVLVVPPGVPVITSATVTPTSGGFNLVVVGYATTRDMTSAAIAFTAAPGITLTSNSKTVQLSQVFTAWYQNSSSAQYGSQFSLEIPFTIQNGTSPLTSVSIALTNSQGSSAVATAAY
ncbi:MAG: putative Ig domain-containing protein [Bryobacteraceae bacterium]